MHVESDGIITVDPDKCIGCHYCEWACPYGSPQFNPAKGIMQKCDFCKDYVRDGKNPVCVDACPMRALGFDQLANLEALHGSNRDAYPMPASPQTNPSAIIRPHPAEARGKELNASIINREEVKNER
jgi:anaerobic dimethyl sulfoxide reductase subunit B (iron-sulfur subunit)